MTDSALGSQVGGGHYKDMKIQPVEFIHANGIPYIEGGVIKYVSRWRKKNGIEDLKKARHFIDLLIQLEEAKKPAPETNPWRDHDGGAIPCAKTARVQVVYRDGTTETLTEARRHIWPHGSVHSGFPNGVDPKRPHPRDILHWRYA